MSIKSAVDCEINLNIYKNHDDIVTSHDEINFLNNFKLGKCQ